MGVPSLVLEVLSETTKSKDMLKKLDLYMNSGVSEYWIVSPFHKEIYVYYFKENEIDDYKVSKGNDTVYSVFFEGLAVVLEQVFNP